MEHLFSNQDLKKIIDESMMYMCACPAQVARAILDMRKLHDYQIKCESDGAGQIEVHREIARATALAHAELERCMDRVLDIEGWDRKTLTMPAELRQYRDDLIQNL